LHELTFEKALGALINMEIGLFLRDKQFIEGVLLDIKQDHIIVNVNQKIVYLAFQHIQALSKNAKDLRISTEVVHYVDRDNLIDVLKALRYNWVSINSFSEQLLFGVLSKISDDHITVINNSELLYIPKSYLSTISSNVSNEQINILNTQEQAVIKDCQLEDIITSEHTKNTKEIERVTNVENPILEMSSRVGVEDENVTYEQSESQQKTREEMYAALLKLLKHNLLNKDVDNELREEVFQERTVRGFIIDTDDKTKRQSDSSVIEVQDCQVEEQVIVEQTQTINENKLIKSLKAPFIEDSAEEVTKENYEVNSQAVSNEVLNLSRVLKDDLQEQVSKYPLEENHPDVLDSSPQISQEEQSYLKKSRLKRKKKRILLSAWSTMNHDQHAVVNYKNTAKGVETLDCEEGPIETEQPSDSINSLTQPLHDQYLHEEVVTMEELPKSIEATISQAPEIRISPKMKKEMLENQYYALMKQAETNCIQMSKRQLNLSEEEQYYALMKHTAKMYHEFKD